jgi:predicted dehydrogenase
VKAIVVGFGSIGRRHTRILKNIGINVNIVSRRNIEGEDNYKDIEIAIEKEDPQYIVVSNSTSEHINTIKKISKTSFEGKLLVEKPLVHEDLEIPDSIPSDTFVAYNMRFHPLLQKLRDRVEGSSVVSAHVYAGQYLPDWRPDRDYRESYSARREKGGGVIRDLSHELDYINWLFGGWRDVASMGGQFSHLEIDSDDVYGVLISTKNCPVVSLQVNYVDRINQRNITVNTEKENFSVDLVSKTFTTSEDYEEYESFDIDTTYKREHAAVLGSREEYEKDMCTLREGEEVVKMIDRIESKNEFK